MSSTYIGPSQVGAPPPVPPKPGDVIIALHKITKAHAIISHDHGADGILQINSAYFQKSRYVVPDPVPPLMSDGW
jgi:hypothetical protein